MLDLRFVRDWAQDRYADRGRPSIDPVVFFKLQLMMFFEGIWSERRLVETASLNLAHRWYLGYGLDEPLPDHSSLTRIRLRLGLGIFERFFEQVVMLCQQAGLVWGKELIFDATKVRANAALDSLVPRFSLDAKEQTQEHLSALFTEESVPTPQVDSLPTPLPTALSAAEAAELAAANTTWRLLDERRLDPTRPAGRGYQRTGDWWASPTDRDATPMRARKGEQAGLGYHDHYVVDGGRARIIMAALITPADVMENQPMLDLLWRVCFRWHLHPERASGDTTYGTVDNIRALEDAGIRAYVPLAAWDRTPYYGPCRFRYDAERDEYRCPEGHPLPRRTAKYTEEATVYRANAATCNACPVKAACTTSDRGRTLQRSFYADYLERVQAYHETAAYQKAMRKRAVWVEPLFGEAKQWHGLRQFRLRGLENVNIEGLLVATGQNLKRWVGATGWGRRHGPQGSLLALAAPPLALLGTRL